MRPSPTNYMTSFRTGVFAVGSTSARCCQVMTCTRRLAVGIRLWDKVLLCCSAAALTSWWVDHEIDLAFEKERQLMRTRGEKVLALIPLDLDGFLNQSPSGKAQQVRSRLAANFIGWTEDSTIFDTQVERVIRAL